ncbi:hypothetical protein [uncultured Roseovarius sp.]|uniref:hypothetical protein n=1 Tax=uncultured Roseovarius sp. TaxID=293344 RepID=UPI002617E8ED|nr:hypothetical protein [uncultured Roseovarius sp.]
MPKETTTPDSLQPIEIMPLKVVSGKRNRLPTLTDAEECTGHKGMWLSKLALTMRDLVKR